MRCCGTRTISPCLETMKSWNKALNIIPGIFILPSLAAIYKQPTKNFI